MGLRKADSHYFSRALIIGLQRNKQPVFGAILCRFLEDGSEQLDTRNNRDFGGAIIQFVGAG